MKKSGVLVILLFAILCLSSSLPERLDVTEILLCNNNEHQEESRWRSNIHESIIRFAKISDFTEEIKFFTSKCPIGFQTSTCAAVYGGIICNADAIERILKTSAWLSSLYINMSEEDYDSIREKNQKLVKKAFLSTDLGNAEGKIKNDILFIQKNDSINSEENPKFNKREITLIKTYKKIVDVNLMGLLGHESFHVMNENCIDPNESVTEKEGLFNLVTHLQLDDTLLCPRDPNINEVLADRCALRLLRNYLNTLNQDQSLSINNKSFIKRISADMLTFQILSGWRIRTEIIPLGKYAYLNFNGYFYAPYRAILVDNELSVNNENQVRICGDSAGLIFDSFREIITYNCTVENAKAIMPTEIENKFSKEFINTFNRSSISSNPLRCN